MRRHDWGYRHRPTSGQLLFAFPRGKVVGGSSAVNTCIALRSNTNLPTLMIGERFGEWLRERGL